MQGEAPQRLLDWHLRKLQWLQHERLIHLIVLFITIALFLTSLAFVVLVPSTLPVSLVVYLILLVLLILLSAPLLLLGEYRAALVSHRRGTA